MLKIVNIANMSLSDVLLQALSAPKLVFGRDSTPDPAEGARGAAPD